MLPLGLLALAMACVTMMTACAATHSIATIGDNPLCHSMKLVSFSAMRDTPETVQQVRENNAAWRVVCEAPK